VIEDPDALGAAGIWRLEQVVCQSVPLPAGNVSTQANQQLACVSANPWPRQATSSAGTDLQSC